MMAGRGIQGSSNMAVHLQNNARFSQSFKGYLGPASSSAVYLSTQSVMNFAEGHCSRIRQPVFWPIQLDEPANDELDDCLNHPEKKRRLTVDQVQFLEKSFELENKLEPERKVQLAKDLGLHPRQVAIWFQNRRARWKTKHLEKEFEVLKCSYDTLKIDYDNLLKEKEELQAKVLSLSNMLHQKEKNGKLQFLECSKRPDKLIKLDSDTDADIKQVKTPMNVYKWEDISSANSIVLDSESPHHYINRGYLMVTEPTCSSTAAFEPAQSDQSQAGEVDEVKDCQFLTLEDNSCNYDLQVGDQTFWSFWS